MRTDVKLGFVIGGILLAVMVVYAVVVGRGSSGAPQQTADLVTPTDMTVDATGSGVTDAANTGGASTSVPPVAEAPVVTAPEPTQTVTPTASSEPVAAAPVEAPAVSPSGKWNWDRLLHEGTTPELMTTSAASEPPASTIAPVPELPAAQQPSQPLNVAYATPAPTPGGPVLTDNAASSNTASSNASSTDASSMIAPQAPRAIDFVLPSNPAARTHTVKSGETLSAISYASYGSAKHWSLIAKANPAINPDRVKPGKVLNIPALPAQTASNAPSPSMEEKAIDSTKQYKVQAGDSLHKIAMKLYGRADQWERIYDTNKVAIGTDPAKLKAGTVLTLPEAPTRTKQAN